MRLYRNQPAGTVARARQLRRAAPEPERRLLQGLRAAFPHLRWRHQAPVGPFYADLLCFSERLVIEVDGDTHAHAHATERDAARTAAIRRSGFRELRFTNADVMENRDGVLEQISFSLREKEGARAAQPRGKDEGDAQEKGDAR